MPLDARRPWALPACPSPPPIPRLGFSCSCSVPALRTRATALPTSSCIWPAPSRVPTHRLDWTAHHPLASQFLLPATWSSSLRRCPRSTIPRCWGHCSCFRIEPYPVRAISLCIHGSNSPSCPNAPLHSFPPSQQDVNSPTRGARLTPHRTTLCSHSPNGIWTTLRTAEDRAAFGGRLGHESCTKRPPLQPLSPPAFSSGLPLSPTTGLPSQRCEGLAPGVWVTQWRLQRVNHNVNHSNCSIRVCLPSAASPMACPCHPSNALLTSSRWWTRRETRVPGRSLTRRVNVSLPSLIHALLYHSVATPEHAILPARARSQVLDCD